MFRSISHLTSHFNEWMAELKRQFIQIHLLYRCGDWLRELKRFRASPGVGKLFLWRARFKTLKSISSLWQLFNMEAALDNTWLL